MYETYFNLAERPFASVPRIDHYYPAGVIDAARNTLTRCIERGEGVGLIIGPSGTGKSLLCQVLAEYFQTKHQVALLASTHLDTRRSLLQAMLYELNRPYRGMDEGELRLALVDYLTLSDDTAGGTLLLVDEAHHLPLRLLDEIRTLTNLTRAMQSAVRLVLAGNHVLEERFASPKLESFSQRISARCYLEAFQSEETQAYIWARIMVCGGGAAGTPAGSRAGGELFPPESCRMVHKATGGVPRLINQVCDHVLLLAYAAGVRRIEPAHVEEAWADLQQLPTPWNAPVTAPAGNGVIEFGGLDDAGDVPQIAGRISAAEDDEQNANENDGVPATAVAATTTGTITTEAVASAPAALAAAPTEDETSEQLEHIRKLLADVQAEFQPVAAAGPEVELVFETPHPFAEPFEEEEVIADRYASAAPATVALATVGQATLARASASIDPVAGVLGSGSAAVETVQATAAAASVHTGLPAETIPIPAQLNRMQAGAPTEAEEKREASSADEHPVRQSRTIVPPPKKQLGRLFAGLRRGL
jgi:type II secretory pathway predicted ATPase ExeA